MANGKGQVLADVALGARYFGWSRRSGPWAEWLASAASGFGDAVQESQSQSSRSG